VRLSAAAPHPQAIDRVRTGLVAATNGRAALINFSFLAFAILMLAISGCGTTPSPTEPESPAPVGNVSAPDVSPLVEAMAQRDRALESLQTSAIMQYSNGTDHVKAREEIIVRRPDRLRVEAMSPLGVALIVAAQDTHLQIFEPSKNTLMHGTADAATLARFARIPMAPRDAVGLLMGIVPEAKNSSRPESVTNEGDMILLTYAGANHSRRELGFHDDQLAMVRERGVAGAIDFEIHYADYHDIGGVMFAYQVDANFPVADTHVSFNYKRPIVNGQIPDSVFTLTPGANAKQIDLGTSHQLRDRSDG
jgi:outer membrane lipoprotein-sorting protein